MTANSRGNLLRSWKEIAAYLGCDVRTCHRWEAKHAMPVHRIQGEGAKSPIFAYKDELDGWFARTFTFAVKKPSWLSRLGKAWAVAVALVLVGAAAFVLFRDVFVRRQPADFAIEGSTLIVLDKHKREVWRKDMGVEDLQTEAYYRENFQVPHTEQMNILPALVMSDIDGDKDIEVLFALIRVSYQTGEGVLYCFDRRGRERWTFRAGRELVCGPKTFSPDYRIAGFYVHDLDGDGRREILVESFQAPDWPCQLAVLDASGKTRGEFWNAGYLRDLDHRDIDGDGRAELIVVGVNNEYKGGCLIVFDTRAIRGGSPQTGDFACRGIGPGSMLYYVLTPYTDVSAASGIPVDGLRQVDLTANDWIRATASNGLIYEFDLGLRCVQVGWGHGFQAYHGQLSRAGAVSSVLNEGYKRTIREGIRYWNGSEWTAEPSPVKR